MKCALLSIAIAFAYVPAPAEDIRSADAFIASARAATAKYRDRNVAIADGYLQIGGDFPGMGQHWIQTGLLFDGKVDPAHPEILTYLVVAGKPQLLGAAYALPLLETESPPDWPAGKDAWHDHFRTLEDETTLPVHHTDGRGGHAPRITMLHAWIWAENPAGKFAADNWSLPYVRLGIEPPKGAPEAAAKALSLASGGAEYFSASINAAARLTTAERKKVDATLARSQRAVDSLLRGRPAVLTASQVEQLSAIWTGLWKAIDASVRPTVRPLVRQLPVR